MIVTAVGTHTVRQPGLRSNASHPQEKVLPRHFRLWPNSLPNRLCSPPNFGSQLHHSLRSPKQQEGRSEVSVSRKLDRLTNMMESAWPKEHPQAGAQLLWQLHRIELRKVAEDACRSSISFQVSNAYGETTSREAVLSLPSSSCLPKRCL